MDEREQQRKVRHRPAQNLPRDERSEVAPTGSSVACAPVAKRHLGDGETGSRSSFGSRQIIHRRRVRRQVTLRGGGVVRRRERKTFCPAVSRLEFLLRPSV